MVKKKGMLCLFVAIFLVLAIGATPVLAAKKVANWILIGALTGPGAMAVLPMAQGNADYVKEINARGGVDGVKIKFTAIDDRYDVARGLSAYQRYRRTPKTIMVTTAKSGVTKACLPLMERDGHITFVSGAGFVQAKIGRGFLYMGVYQDIFGAALDWMVKDWQKKGNPGKPVVGYMTWEGAYGKQALNGGSEYAKKLGVKLLPPEFYPPGSIKHDTWLERLARLGANYIYMGGVDPSQANIVRDAHAMGLTDKIQMVSAEWGIMATVGVKVHPKVLEGTVLVTPMIRGEDRIKHPMARLWTKYQKKPLEDMNPFYLMGIGSGMVIEEALRIALKDSGYENLNGNTMMKALEKLEGKDVSQGIFGVCDYSPTSRRGSRQVKMYQVRGGKLIPISDWITAPDCISLAKY